MPDRRTREMLARWRQLTIRAIGRLGLAGALA
jgi:hypothetical protein